MDSEDSDDSESGPRTRNSRAILSCGSTGMHPCDVLHCWYLQDLWRELGFWTIRTSNEFTGKYDGDATYAHDIGTKTKALSVCYHRLCVLTLRPMPSSPSPQELIDEQNRTLLSVKMLGSVPRGQAHQIPRTRQPSMPRHQPARSTGLSGRRFLLTHCVEPSLLIAVQGAEELL
jgi:hypothetical protein